MGIISFHFFSLSLVLWVFWAVVSLPSSHEEPGLLCQCGILPWIQEASSFIRLENSTSLDWGSPQGRGWASHINWGAPQKVGLGPLRVLLLLWPGTWSSQKNNYWTHSHWLWILCGRVWPLPGFLDMDDTPHPSPGLFPRGSNFIVTESGSWQVTG